MFNATNQEFLVCGIINMYFIYEFINMYYYVLLCGKMDNGKYLNC